MNESGLVSEGVVGGFSSMEATTAAQQSDSVPPHVEVVAPPSLAGDGTAAAAVAAVAPVSSDSVGPEAGAVGAETAEESEEPVVPAELYKTATEAQAHGEPYFLYREETTGETNAMPVKKQPLQYVPKHLDWYCTICRYWVDDEQDVCVPPPPHSSFCVPSLSHIARHAGGRPARALCARTTTARTCTTCGARG